MAALPPELSATLAMTAAALHDARDPWWIISGAAVALHGVDTMAVSDVDVLTSHADAAMLAAHLSLPVDPAPRSELFRSDLFVRWDVPPLPVEIMAGLHVATVQGWQQIEPVTRLAVQVGGSTVLVPERDELCAMLRLFGRAKDHARVALLEMPGRQ